MPFDRGGYARRRRHGATARPTLRARTGQAKHSRAGCKKGAHIYGAEQPIGGGIIRRLCESCGAVSIDLRDATEPVTEVPSMERRSWVLEPEPPPPWGSRRAR